MYKRQVRGQIGRGVDGSKLMLSGGYLIVLRFGQDTQLPQLSVQLLHEGGDTGLDGAKVVIVQLLPLGGLGAEQGPAGIDQVLALLIQSLVDQEMCIRDRYGAAPAR